MGNTGWLKSTKAHLAVNFPRPCRRRPFVLHWRHRTSNSGITDIFRKQPWPTDTMTKFSAAVVDGKIWAGDRNGSIYELDGGKFNKIAESPPNDAGDVGHCGLFNRRCADCQIVGNFSENRRYASTMADRYRFSDKKLLLYSGQNGYWAIIWPS